MIHNLNHGCFSIVSAPPTIHVFGHLWISREAAEAKIAKLALLKPIGDVTDTTSVFYTVYGPNTVIRDQSASYWQLRHGLQGNLMLDMCEYVSEK